MNFRVIYDRYHTTNRSLYGQSGLVDPVSVDLNTLGINWEYQFELNERSTLTPYIKYLNQEPWKITDPRVIGNIELVDRTALRQRVGLNYSREGESNSLLAGAEVGQDKSIINNYVDFDGTTTTFKDGTRQLEFNTVSAFVQNITQFENYDLTAGLRYDRHDVAGDAIVPRLGLTMARKKWHFKALAAGAFKYPASQNLNLNENIKPEKTETLEVELGYKLGRRDYITGNVYYLNIRDAIVFGTVNGQDVYFNSSRTGTYGLELDYRYKSKREYLTAGYSYYRANNNKVDTYAVPGNSELMLAQPQHKFSVNYSRRLSRKLNANPSLIYMNNRYAHYDSEGTYGTGRLPDNVMFNLFFTYNNFLIKNLGLGAGVYNIFSNETLYPQPYVSTHNPLPGPSREVVVRLDYKINAL